MSTIGERIRDLRSQSNMKQKDLIAALKSKGIEITRTSISRWENGVYIPAAWTLKCLAQIFDVSMDYLLDKEGGSTAAIEIGAHGSGHKLLPPECQAIMERCAGLNDAGMQELSKYVDYLITRPEFKKGHSDSEDVEKQAG